MHPASYGFYSAEVFLVDKKGRKSIGTLFSYSSRSKIIEACERLAKRDKGPEIVRLEVN